MTPTQEPARAGDLERLNNLIARVDEAASEYHLWDRHIGGEVSDALQEYRRHLAQPAVPDGDGEVVGWLDAEGYVWQADARAEGIDFMRRNDKDPSMRPVIAARSAEEK